MKKIIFITIFIILFLGIGQEVFAVELLIKDYPKMGDIELSKEPTLPEMIKYIYLFSLGIVGFVALISMLIGAIRYIASAGNASKAEDAKDQMTQAILGIIILLAAVLILRTINPDLVNIGLTLPQISPSGGGTMGWACYHCNPPATYPDPLAYCKDKYPSRYIDFKFCRTDITTESQAKIECKKVAGLLFGDLLVKQEVCK